MSLLAFYMFVQLNRRVWETKFKLYRINKDEGNWLLVLARLNLYAIRDSISETGQALQGGRRAKAQSRRIRQCYREYSPEARNIIRVLTAPRGETKPTPKITTFVNNANVAYA